MARLPCSSLLLLFLSSQLALLVAGEFLRLPSEKDVVGTRWAVLIAGSNGYYNYRHQAGNKSPIKYSSLIILMADVCHAYQIMKKGGLKDENIIVFMYDDIAGNRDNPRPGVIINHPKGGDVYAGVPKDYTGADVNANNFLAALLGDKSKLTGSGSGKVVSSGPDDHIFVYYADHGGPGILGMPGDEEYLYANDLVRTLEKKHAGGAGSVELIGGLLFGSEEGAKVLGAVRPAGQPVVDDWDCLKSVVRTFQQRCGPLTQYGMKHMRSLANLCNAGVREEAMDKAASQACAANPSSLF
ncbi:unnamed protein product [Triticum turgidum subsp. durum]|uniref:Legumain prodomain domain-containing protein n=1 Tax=Triticum turgidum subsp. durum TaxID=4567 RepID=A0A9R0XAC2_TRITD|nr:unnamed protein product [Triticum turgidum subsp. durum]